MPGAPCVLQGVVGVRGGISSCTHDAHMHTSAAANNVGNAISSFGELEYPTREALDSK